LDQPDPDDKGVIARCPNEWWVGFRFIRLDHMADTSLGPTRASFNPLQRSHPGEGGRFDAVAREEDHWLYDPYSYAYFAKLPQGAYYEVFGDAIRARAREGLPPELDYRYGIEVVLITREIIVVPLDVHWELRSVPFAINQDTDYFSCREWATFIRLRHQRIDGLRYQARQGYGPAVVLFGGHAAMTRRHRTTEDAVRVTYAAPVSDDHIQAMLRNAGTDYGRYFPD
jgi:hypothetical protein